MKCYNIKYRYDTIIVIVEVYKHKKVKQPNEHTNQGYS